MEVPEKDQEAGEEMHKRELEQDREDADDLRDVPLVEVIELVLAELRNIG